MHIFHKFACILSLAISLLVLSCTLKRGPDEMCACAAGNSGDLAAESHIVTQAQIRREGMERTFTALLVDVQDPCSQRNAVEVYIELASKLRALGKDVAVACLRRILDLLPPLESDSTVDVDQFATAIVRVARLLFIDVDSSIGSQKLGIDPPAGEVPPRGCQLPWVIEFNWPFYYDSLESTRVRSPYSIRDARSILAYCEIGCHFDSVGVLPSVTPIEAVERLSELGIYPDTVLVTFRQQALSWASSAHLVANSAPLSSFVAKGHFVPDLLSKCQSLKWDSDRHTFLNEPSKSD